jgi:hypothetical protein
MAITADVNSDPNGTIDEDVSHYIGNEKPLP